ncbi:MAG: NADPH:quinone oxidoreductase family protein [Acidobacteria bacterium]|nr:NADPH:quinone oxidoreductase family protein [Acidobacteriota bacterium]
MRAWQVHAWGEPESMKLADVPAPRPGPREVRIRHRAAGLNFFDLLQVRGAYQYKPPFPFTPGAELSGVVDAVGAEVAGFAEGDGVLAFPSLGGFAEGSVVDSGKVFRIPEGMSFDQAAAMLVVYQTSYFALKERAALRAGEWLLVHAGASGTGMSAIQIGKAMGARVLATAGSFDKRDFCLSQGAEHALDYTGAAWVDQVKEITGGRGADVIYDPVGGDVCDLSTKCIAPEGRLLIIGFAGGRIPSIAANRILLKNISVVGAVWGGYLQRHPGYLAETQRALELMYRAGQIRPVISRAYGLKDVPRALRDLAERKIAGKAVIHCDNLKG